MYEDLLDIRIMDNSNLAIRMLDVENMCIKLPTEVTIDKKPYVLTNKEQYITVPVKNAVKDFKKHSDNIAMSVLSKVGLNKYKYGVIIIGDSILFNHPALTFVLNKDTLTIYRQHMYSMYGLNNYNTSVPGLQLRISSEAYAEYLRNAAGTQVKLFLYGEDDYGEHLYNVFIKRFTRNVVISPSAAAVGHEPIFSLTKVFSAIQKFYIMNKFSSVNDLLADDEDDWGDFEYATGSLVGDDAMVLTLLKEDGYEI